MYSFRFNFLRKISKTLLEILIISLSVVNFLLWPSLCWWKEFETSTLLSVPGHKQQPSAILISPVSGLDGHGFDFPDLHLTSLLSKIPSHDLRGFDRLSVPRLVLTGKWDFQGTMGKPESPTSVVVFLVTRKRRFLQFELAAPWINRLRLPLTWN